MEGLLVRLNTVNIEYVLLSLAIALFDKYRVVVVVPPAPIVLKNTSNPRGFANDVNMGELLSLFAVKSYPEPLLSLHNLIRLPFATDGVVAPVS
jgi:hypothetical protein